MYDDDVDVGDEIEHPTITLARIHGEVIGYLSEGLVGADYTTQETLRELVTQHSDAILKLSTQMTARPVGQLKSI